MSLPGTRDQALWQFFLSLLVLSFGFQRGLGVWIGVRAEAPRVVLAVFALEALLAAIAALGIWLGHRWAPYATLALGVGVALGGAMQSAFGPLPAGVAFSRGAVALVTSTGLAWLLRYEFRRAPDERQDAAGSRHDRSDH